MYVYYNVCIYKTLYIIYVYVNTLYMCTYTYMYM